MEEMKLKQITFIVPRSYCVYLIQKQDIPQGFVLKIVVEVDSGGFIDEGLYVEYFTDRGVSRYS